MGTLFIIWNVVFASIILSFILYMLSRWSNIARKMYKKFSELVFYGLILRLMIESMLEFCICSMMDFKIVSTLTLC